MMFFTTPDNIFSHLKNNNLFTNIMALLITNYDCIFDHKLSSSG